MDCSHGEIVSKALNTETHTHTHTHTHTNGYWYLVCREHFRVTCLAQGSFGHGMENGSLPTARRPLFAPELMLLLNSVKPTCDTPCLCFTVWTKRCPSPCPHPLSPAGTCGCTEESSVRRTMSSSSSCCTSLWPSPNWRSAWCKASPGSSSTCWSKGSSSCLLWYSPYSGLAHPPPPPFFHPRPSELSTLHPSMWTF